MYQKVNWPVSKDIEYVSITKYFFILEHKHNW